MNNVTYPHIIDECYDQLKAVDYPITRLGVYHNLLTTGIINRDGTPTRFAIEHGLVGLKETDTPVDSGGVPIGKTNSIVTRMPYDRSAVQKKIDEQDMDNGAVPFKFIDPQAYMNGLDNGYRMKVDRYVQSTYAHYNNFMVDDLKHKVVCDKENIKAIKYDNPVMTASIVKLAHGDKSKEAQLKGHIIDSNLKDIKNLSHVILLRSQYPVERDFAVDFISVIYAKIIEWQLLATAPSGTVKFIKAHTSYNSRCLMDDFGKNKDTKGLDSLNKANKVAKLIWNEHIFCNQLKDKRRFWKINKRVAVYKKD